MVAYRCKLKQRKVNVVQKLLVRDANADVLIYLPSPSKSSMRLGTVAIYKENSIRFTQH